jgi:predicted nucleic acid-binding protein
MAPVRYVGDTSVIIQAVIAEANSPQVETLLAGLISPGSITQLWIPDYCLVECGNVLWSHVQFKGLAQSDAENYLQWLLRLPLHIASSRKLLPRTLEIAQAQGITVYDAGFLALAEKLACPLITEDAKQATAATKMGLALKPIIDFPPAVP